MVKDKIYNRLLGIILFFILGAVIAQIVGVGLLSLFGRGFFDKFGQMITYPLMFVPPMLYNYSASRKGKFFSRGYDLDNNHFEPLGFTACAILVVLATISLAWITDPISSLLPPMPFWLQEALTTVTGGPLWITLLCVSVMAPFFEEWLCRGTILGGLLCKMKPVWAIVLSALFFALIHMNPWQGIPAFLLGCLFGWVYYKTGSLKLTMIMHCANNTLSVLVGYFAGSEVETFRQLFPRAMLYTIVFASFALLLVLCVRSLDRISPKGLDKGPEAADGLGSAEI